MDILNFVANSPTRPSLNSLLSILYLQKERPYRGYVPARHALASEYRPARRRLVTVTLDSPTSYAARRLRRERYETPPSPPLFVQIEQQTLRSMPDFWDRPFATGTHQPA